MKKEHVVAILVFGTVWGAAEAILGGALFRARIHNASIPLAVIAFAVLTVARVSLPRPGVSILIACCALLYQFLNAPFFACHLLGVVALGVGHDLMWRVTRVRDGGPVAKALGGVAAAYLGFALFAFPVTYLFRHPHWVGPGLAKVLRHVFLSGSIAAACCLVVVPAAAWAGAAFKARRPVLVEFRPTLANGAVSLIVVALWGLSALVTF